MTARTGCALIVVSGLPGVGKTAVAAAVAVRTGGVHLSIDPVEDAMLVCGLPAGWNLGVAAYEAVRTMTEANLALGRVVVVDAVNDSEESRDTWRRVASKHTATLTFAYLTCSDPDEHRRRLEQRRRRFFRLEDQTWPKVLDRAREYAPWRDEHLDLDTLNTSVEEACERVCAYAAQRHAVESRFQAPFGQSGESVLRYRETFDERSLELAGILQSWDPLGVYRDKDNRPDDDEEYDDLVQPIRGWLEDGASPEELSAHLVRLLQRRYGLGPADESAEIELTRRIHAWWSGR